MGEEQQLNKLLGKLTAVGAQMLSFLGDCYGFCSGETVEHLEGVLHSSTITFVIILAYLRLDKIELGQSEKEPIDGNSQERITAIRILSSKDLITGGKGKACLGPFRSHISSEIRADLSLIFSLARQAHDLYENRMVVGKLAKLWDRGKHFFLLSFLDGKHISYLSKALWVVGAITFYLFYAATFNHGISTGLAKISLLVDFVTVIMIVMFVSKFKILKSQVIPRIEKVETWMSEIDKKSSNKIDEDIQRPLP